MSEGIFKKKAFFYYKLDIIETIKQKMCLLFKILHN